MTPVTAEQLAEWKALADAATRGGWKARQFDGEGWHYIFAAHPAVPELAQVAGANNGAFIAAARTAVPALIAEVERLLRVCRVFDTLAVRAADTIDRQREEIGRLRTMLESLADNEIAEAMDAINTVHSTLRHRQQPYTPEAREEES